MFSIFLIGFFPSAKFLLFRSLGSVSESSVKAPTYFLGKMKTSFLLSKTLDKTDILVYKSRYPPDPRNGGLILLPSGWIFDLVVSGCQYFLHKYQNKFHIPLTLSLDCSSRRRPLTDCSGLQWPELLPPRGDCCHPPVPPSVQRILFICCVWLLCVWIIDRQSVVFCSCM